MSYSVPAIPCLAVNGYTFFVGEANTRQYTAEELAILNMRDVRCQWRLRRGLQRDHGAATIQDPGTALVPRQPRNPDQDIDDLIAELDGLLFNSGV